MVLKHVALTCVQGGNDAFVQASKRLVGRKNIKIVKMTVELTLAGALADTHQFQVQLTKTTQSAILSASNNQRAWGRTVTVAGAPSGVQEPYWEVHNLPAITGVDDIFVSFDSANTAGINTAIFNIWYQEYSGGY